MRIGEAKKRDDLLQALDEAQKRRKEKRLPYDTVWWNNIALLAGDHYTRWNPLRGEFLQVMPKEEHTVRLVLNHAMTVGRTELAKLTKSKPLMDVVPNSEESGDVSAAKVGKSILDAFEWKFRLRRMRKQAYWWMIATGLGAVYVGWDPANKRDGSLQFMLDPATKEPTFNEERKQTLRDLVQEGVLTEDDLKMDEQALGDIDYKVYSPFQLLPDELATDWIDLRDLITIDVVDVDVARANWDNNDIQPESGVAPGTVDQSVMFRAGLLGMGTNTPDEVRHAVAVYTWWLLPGTYGGKYLQDGKMIRWCNGRKVLEESDAYPFQDDRIPFAFFEHIPSAVSLWPDSVMQHIRGPNLEMDKTASQLIEAKDYMANPMWLVPTQCDVPKDIRSIPGGVVRYRHVPNVPEPHPIEGIMMPPQVENLLAGLRSQILDISGQGEVSRGTQLPSGVRSGVQVAYLQEEDETRLGPTAENIEDGISIMGSLTLERVSQFYHTNRIVRFYKSDGTFDVMRFKGADLKNNTDVVVLAGSALPKSKAARQQYTLELVQLGIERNPKRIKDMLEIGEGEPDDIDKAYAQADRENHAMVQGVLTGTAPGFYSIQDPDNIFQQVPGAGGAGIPSGAAPNGGPPTGGALGSPTADLSPTLTTKTDFAQGELNTRAIFAGGGAPGAGGGPPGGGSTPQDMLDQATGAHAPTTSTTRGPVAIPVKNWHNHTAHLERHYGFMTDEYFEKLAVAHPEIVRLFDEHTAMHEQALAAQRQAELQAAMAMRGGPDQGNGAAGSHSPHPGRPDVMSNEADLRGQAQGAQQ